MVKRKQSIDTGDLVKGPKVLVLGLDGATWSLLRPWAEQGELPTFQKFLNEGSWGKLESTIPPVTFPAWKCYSTGKNPGKIGVYWWMRVDFEKNKLVVHNSYSFKSKDFWDYLGEAGWKVGIINMPGTYPPKKVNGFMISGVLSEDICTYPPDLSTTIREKFNYKVNPTRFIREYGPQALEDLDVVIFEKFKVVHEFIDEVDFMHFTVFYIDKIQHYFWNNKEIILSFYKKIDDQLKKLVQLFDITFLISDHGFTSIKNCLFINNWLQSKGYLTTKRNYQNVLDKVGLNYENIETLFRKTKLIYLYRKLPERIQRKMTKQTAELTLKKDPANISTGSFQSRIDWNKTIAVATGEGPIYLNKDRIKSQYEDIRNELIHHLSLLRDPTTEEKAIAEVFRKEDIYLRRYLEKAPDLVVLPKNGYELLMGINQHGLWRSECTKADKATLWQGSHIMHGVFLAMGEGIKRGNKVLGARIYDIAPTILYIYGIPPPDDLDGRVLKEIFVKNS